MTVLKLCGIAVLGVAAILVVRSAKSEFAIPLSVVTGTILLTSALATVYPMVDFVKELSDVGSFTLYASTILKALGIGLLSQSAVDFCHDCGENAIASKLEFAAKAGILLLGLPIIRELLALATEMMK